MSLLMWRVDGIQLTMLVRLRRLRCSSVRLEDKVVGPPS